MEVFLQSRYDSKLTIVIPIKKNSKPVFLGRGPTTRISDTKCSRQQVKVSKRVRKNEPIGLEIQPKHRPLTVHYKEEDELEEITKDNSVILHIGDSFSIFETYFWFTICIDEGEPKSDTAPGLIESKKVNGKTTNTKTKTTRNAKMSSNGSKKHEILEANTTKTNNIKINTKLKAENLPSIMINSSRESSLVEDENCDIDPFTEQSQPNETLKDTVKRTVELSRSQLQSNKKVFNLHSSEDEISQENLNEFKIQDESSESLTEFIFTNKNNEIFYTKLDPLPNKNLKRKPTQKSSAGKKKKT